MRQKKKWIFSIVAVLILVVIISMFLLNKVNSRESVLEKISTAIDNNDPQLLISLMPIGMQSYPTAEESAKYFIKTAKNNKEMTLQLLNETNRISADFPYTVALQGKTLFFFDKYVFLPSATNLTLKNVDDDVTLEVNGKHMNTVDLQKPFLAGSYTFEAIKKSNWTNLRDTKTVNAGDKPSKELIFNLDGYRLDLSKELKGAEILFKGEKTGIKVGDPESTQFGPIKEEDSMEVQLLASFPWGETKSSHYDKMYYTLGSGSHFYFKPDEKAANELYIKFAEEYAQASVKQSTEPFKSTTEKFRVEQANEYTPSLFGNLKYKLIKTYFNKETPKIVIDKDGNPVMKMEGVIRYKRLKTDYFPEKEEVFTLAIKSLYDGSQKVWRVDEANFGSYASLPDQNEEEKYIVTSTN
ncbi:TcaA 3rd/4th domain-containing protein [Paenibacillus sp. SN-8-1]|uniref:TcaA 3rd/4th domain-containing protein n=1 Tax=Paenibacillus sp. SN-8-1 TaxID=3435409 RepID=UPI003D9A6AEF